MILTMKYGCLFCNNNSNLGRNFIYLGSNIGILINFLLNISRIQLKINFLDIPGVRGETP